MHIINSERFDILSNSDTDISIYNLTEVMHMITLHPKYKLILYTMDIVEGFEIKSESFFEKLKEYCSENFKYSLMYSIDNDKEEVNVWITPLVSSA